MRTDDFEESLRLLGSKYNDLKRRYLYQIISVDLIVEFRAQLFELCYHHFHIDLSDMYQHIDIKCSPENSSAIQIVDLTKIGELMTRTLSIAEDIYLDNEARQRSANIIGCSSCKYKPMPPKEFPCNKCTHNLHPEVRNKSDLEDLWEPRNKQ